MFQSQRVKKVDIIITKNESDEVSKEIVKFGDFQIIEIDSDKAKKISLTKSSLEDYTSRFNEYDRRINYLSGVFHPYSIASAIGEIVKTEELVILDEFEIQKKLKEIETELNNYLQEMEELKRRHSDIEIKIRKINFFSGFDLRWNKLKDLNYFFAGFGIIPQTSYDGFISAMSTIPSAIHLIDNIDNDIVVFFATPKILKEKVEIILKNVYFRDYGLPYDLDKNARLKLVRYAFDLSSTLDEEIWLERNYNKLASKSVSLLTHLKESVQYYLSMAKLKNEMVSTNRIMLFSGWVPAVSIEILKNSIGQITHKKNIFLEQDAITAMETEGLIPPTKFSNPRFLRPFEGLVSTFGVPNYREIDPTPIAAIAYIIMYGAMFGDVGQGLILALAGFIGMSIKKFKSIRSFATVIFYIGISSTVFGFLYGSIFGHENILKPIWFSPAEHVMNILAVAIYFGAFIISLGLILSIINSFLEKDYGRLFFAPTGIAGLAVYWSAFYIAYSVLMNKPFLTWISIIPIIAFIAIAFEKRLEILLFHHKKHGHTDEEEEKPNLVLGIVEVFESAIAFLSKTFSFLRVGAFALNHGALMGAFFVLSSMSNNTIIQWLIILIGNIFIIGFEGGIVGIQALRLEYYEFFVAFFRANGKAFEGLGIYKNT